MDTAEMIQGCLAGSEEAIEALVHTYQQRVFRLALSILDDGGPTLSQAEAAAEAEEATQDVFLAALKGLHGYQGRAAFTTWLYAITLNICRNRYQKRQALRRLKNALQGLLRPGQSGDPLRVTGAVEPVAGLHPEDVLVRREAGGRLWQAVNALGQKHRVVVILHYYHDFSVAEIAQMLGVSEGTVHSRLFTARERLRETLSERTLPVGAGRAAREPGYSLEEKQS